MVLDHRSLVRVLHTLLKSFSFLYIFGGVFLVGFGVFVIIINSIITFGLQLPSL